MPPRPTTIRSPMQRRPHGFTLIELMVVIGIIVLMSTILLISTRAMTQGNSLAQAGNVLSAYLSNARALALQSGNYAGVALFEDPNNANQTAMRIIVSTGPAGAANQYINFTTARGYDIQYLPRDMEVAALDGGNVQMFRYLNSGGLNLYARVVLFDSNGRLVVRDGLTTTPFFSGYNYGAGDLVEFWNGSTYSCYVCIQATNGTQLPTNADYWNREGLGLHAYYPVDAYNSALLDNASFGRSSPALLIFDAIAFADASSAGFPGVAGATPAAKADNWLQQNGQVVAVNAYTGSLIK